MPKQEELRRSPEAEPIGAEAPEVGDTPEVEAAGESLVEVAALPPMPEVSAAETAAEAARAESEEGRLLREVSEILSEDLREVYDKLSTDRQRAFDESGDELVRKIISEAQAHRLTLPGIHGPVLEWLQQLKRDAAPEFLAQTAMRAYGRLVNYFQLANPQQGKTDRLAA